MDARSTVQPIELQKAMHRFMAWLDAFGDTSQDQYDLWASPLGRWAKGTYYRNKWAGAPLVAPLVLLDAVFPAARAFARRPHRFAIADAHYAMAFFALMEAEQDEAYGQRAHGYLQALVAERCKGYEEYCWGYPFDWETAVGTLRAGTPLITTIAYCYEAFEAGHEATGSAEYSAIMESVARFAHESLTEAEVSPGVFACSYTPMDNRRVINANAYRSYLLVTAGQRFGNKRWLETAAGNIRFVLQCQQEDGAWFYAADGMDQFIDNCHTCFVLKNLIKIWRINRDPGLLSAIRRGYDFYKQHLLDERGLPLAFARTQRLNFIRVELYDYAEGINLALLMREIDSDASKILSRLLYSVLRDWALPDGHFATRMTWVGKNSIPYHRWAQAQLFCSLAHCCLEMR